MLTPVSLGQVRFTLPGLVPDARGIVAGRELAARFATLDRLVWFLRLLSAERPPDELWVGMRIVHARTPLGLRESIAVMPNPSSHAADAVARAGRTAGGQCFTGTGKHLVQYRDGRAPLGYDARELLHDPADLILYAADGTAACRQESELSLERLLLGLELRRSAGMADAVPAGDGRVLYVAVRRGLAGPLIGRLLAAGVRGEAAACEPARGAAFGAPTAFWLLRVEGVPARLVGLLSGTPGLALFVPVLDNVAVATGHEHPIHLEACRAVLKTDRFLLLAPSGVTTLPTPLPFVPLADAVPMRVPPPAEVPQRALAAKAPPPLELPLRLESGAGLEARVVGAWIPWTQAPWLRRLCYALPAAALHDHRVALLEPAILLLAESELEGLPFGQPLAAVAPGVLAPVGTRLAPAVAPERVAERLGVGQGHYLVFPARDARPVRVSAAQLEPLERHVLAQARLEADRPPLARRELPPLEEAPPPDVAHDALGPWPLWGLK